MRYGFRSVDQETMTTLQENQVLKWDGTKWVPTAMTGGTSDHGALTGLTDDDHSQYHNDVRGDARYEPKNSNIQAHVTAEHAPATAEQNVNADWNAGSGDAQILNKPTLGDAAAKNTGTTAGTVAAGDHNHTGVYEASGSVSTHAGAADPHTGYQKESEKGAANGYASLDAGTLVPVAQLGSGTPTGAKYLRDDRTWQTVAASGDGLGSDGDKGDITVGGTGTTLTIDNQAVTYAKMQNVTDARLLGRSAGSSGSPHEITVGSGLSLSGGALTATGGSSPSGVFDDLQISLLQEDGTLNAASGVQTWAGTNGTGQDVFTLVANTTYLVSGQWIVNTGATTHTTAMAWSTGATITSFQYQVMLWSAAANAIATAQSTVHVTGVASKVLNATSTAVYTNIQFWGIMVVGNTGGAITPQINFSANPTGTNLMKRGSWISFSRLGTDTMTKTGGWA